MNTSAARRGMRSKPNAKEVLLGLGEHRSRVAALQRDDPRQCDGGVDLAVPLRRHCDSDPIGPLAGSAILS